MLETQTQPRPNLTVDGVSINVLSLHEAVNSIVSAAQVGDNFSVCTLNLDHVVQLQHRADFRAAYRRARFVTADGFPIVVLSRLLGTRIERTTGADLIEPLCQEAGKKGLPVFLLGSNESTLATTARRLSERYQRTAGRRAVCPRLAFRSLFERGGLRDRQHSRFRRETLLRRAWRAAPGTVRGALSRRTGWNRHAVHRRRPRLHCGHAKPRAVHYAEGRTRMGMADVARTAPARAYDTHAASAPFHDL